MKLEIKIIATLIILFGLILLTSAALDVQFISRSIIRTMIVVLIMLFELIIGLAQVWSWIAKKE
jgi:hypothetical protein